MIAVQSSNLAGVDYGGRGTLVIAFHSGGIHEFYHVPYAECAGLMKASSHGEYFHAHIKNRYPYRRIQ